MATTLFSTVSIVIYGSLASIETRAYLLILKKVGKLGKRKIFGSFPYPSTQFAALSLQSSSLTDLLALIIPNPSKQGFTHRAEPSRSKFLFMSRLSLVYLSYSANRTMKMTDNVDSNDCAIDRNQSKQQQYKRGLCFAFSWKPSNSKLSKVPRYKRIRKLSGGWNCNIER